MELWGKAVINLNYVCRGGGVEVAPVDTSGSISQIRGREVSASSAGGEDGNLDLVGTVEPGVDRGVGLPLCGGGTIF